VEAWQRGDRVVPDFTRVKPGQVAGLRGALEGLFAELSTADPWSNLYAQRAAELALEAQAVEALGTEGFPALAARRYGADLPSADLEAAHGLARQWLAEGWIDSTGPRVSTDNPREGASLYASLVRAIGDRRVPFRVAVSADLFGLAATGEDVVAVAQGETLTTSACERTVLHELEGHVLPRAEARASGWAFLLVGSAGASEAEEGRALLLEERAGCWDRERRVELAARHLACAALRDGADWGETVEHLAGLGVPLAEAMRCALRAWRGGGLGRELVYLPSWLSVREALRVEPGLEEWLRRGRLSLSAARVLRQLGPPPQELASGSR